VEIEMLSSRKKQLLVVAGVAGALGLAVLLACIVARPAVDAFFYPKPRSLPPVVSETTEILLDRLQSTLQKHAPMVLTNLYPGLSEAQLIAFEAEGGLQLPEEMRALYRWRNGAFTNQADGIIPGHWFPPLEWLLANRAALRAQLQAHTAVQIAAYRVFTGHREGWIEVFPDGAGDGYFYDPKRSEKEGPFFYNFAETGYYQWFPSFRNFLAGVIECYESGAYRVAAGGTRMEEDSERTETILKRYGSHNLDAL